MNWLVDVVALALVAGIVWWFWLPPARSRREEDRDA